MADQVHHPNVYSQLQGGGGHADLDLALLQLFLGGQPGGPGQAAVMGNHRLFSHALVVSAIPEVATQLYMAFGSVALFDNHFNIAHFLKIIAYLVPFTGLALDYLYTYRKSEQTRGEGDAISAKTYADSFNQDREFYSFYRSMNAYQNSFGNNQDLIVLSPDSDYFKYFKYSTQQ